MLESILVIKIAGAVKGAVFIAAHIVLPKHVLLSFVSMAKSGGLIQALHALVDTLVAMGTFAGVVEALRSLIDSISKGDQAKILTAVANVTTSVLGRGN